MGSFKRDNPGPCGCCCLHGQICVTVLGCTPNAPGPFHIVITDDTGVVGEGDTGGIANRACFTVAGNKQYTVTITRDRWQTRTFTFDAPCSDIAWEHDETITMVAASGYACVCTCPDPVKLPLTANDGFGDITLSGTGGAALGTGCVLRTVGDGIQDCGPAYCDDVGSVETPVEFSIGCDFAAVAAPRFWTCFDAYGTPTTRLVEGSCPGAACDTSPDPPPSPCGTVVETGHSLQCSPFRVELAFTTVGCLADIYGGTLTITVTEAA